MVTIEQFIEFRSKLADNNNYSTVPLWIREKILKNLDALIALDDGQFEISAKDFRLGAAYFVRDSCGSEADELMADVPH
jgi:hypothetical protein